MHETLPELAHAVGKFASQLMDGQSVGGLRLRFDQVGDSLRLREVEFAVEKSALGEFPRFG
jgi:hypothetical protein